MPNYYEEPIYKILEDIIKSAGVRIDYVDVPNDIYARSHYEGNYIQMPSKDIFDDSEHACLVLGHEMGHILSRYDTEDKLELRMYNEAVCDLIGVYLYRLACMYYEKYMEKLFKDNGN